MGEGVVARGTREAHQGESVDTPQRIQGGEHVGNATLPHLRAPQRHKIGTVGFPHAVDLIVNTVTASAQKKWRAPRDMRTKAASETALNVLRALEFSNHCGIPFPCVVVVHEKGVNNLHSNVDTTVLVD